MTSKWVKTSKRMLLLYCTLGGLIFLFAPPSLTGKIQLAYARAFGGVLTTGRQLTLASRTAQPTESITVGDSPEAIAAQRQLREQLAGLQAQNRRLQNHVTNLEEQVVEEHRKNDELARLRTVREWDRMRFQLAGIIALTGPNQSELLIDRGQEDGLQVGQYVVGELSMIGVVSDVSAQTARVRLITDLKSTIPVVVTELDARGLMQGMGDGTCEIINVDTKRRTPQQGLRVCAVKTPGFPSVPIVSAEVVGSRHDLDNPQLWRITVRPVCDIANLTSVAVIISERQ